MPKRVRPHSARPVPTLGQPHPKGYRVKIGDKRFWLGRDRGQAQELLNLIVAEWAAIQQTTAQPAWTPHALALIEQTKADHRGVAAAGIPAPAAAPAVRDGLSLSAAVESYLARRREDMLAGQIQASRLSLLHYSLARLFWARRDGPLAALSADDIRAVVQFFLRRPVSPRTGAPLGPQTVVETLYFVRKMFEDLRDRGLWTPPQPIERLFAYRRDNLWTDAEREAMSEVKVFTLDEIRTLWHVAGEGSRTQLYIALAVNCGFTQTEIATLRHAHLNLDGDKPYLHRFRHKTKVRGRWRLWPETVTLLRRHLTDPAVSDVALVSPRGRPLVRISEAGRSDDIRSDWMNLRQRLVALAKKESTREADWKAKYDQLSRESPALADELLAQLRLPPGTPSAHVAAAACRLTLMSSNRLHVSNGAYPGYTIQLGVTNCVADASAGNQRAGGHQLRDRDSSARRLRSLSSKGSLTAARLNTEMTSRARFCLRTISGELQA